MEFEQVTAALWHGGHPPSNLTEISAKKVEYLLIGGYAGSADVW